MHTVLVMGARGAVGRHVLEQLIAAGVPVRASARRPAPGHFPDGVDVRAADLTDADSLRRAFDGVARVFLYAQREGAKGVLDAARETGVERLVLLSSGSVLHPTSRGNVITEEHREIEEAFLGSGDVAVVPVRPFVLAGNALAWAGPIRAGEPLPLFQPEAATAPIHERDVAAVAVAALLGDGGDAVSAMLTGPARLTQREQVAAIGAAVGRDIEVDELSREAAAERYRRFTTPEEAEAIVQFLDDAAAGNSGTTRAVENLLGRPALPFDVWAADHADDFR